jgi:DNA-binding NarL/FixJ family response regulator
VDANVMPRQAAAIADDVRCLSIAIVSEVRFRREALAEVLERDPLVSAVRLCADLSDATALSPEPWPDVVLVDAGIADGAAAVKRALDIVSGLRIVVFAVNETEDDIISWAQAGVVGYIPNSAALGDLVRLIVDIHDGRQPCSSRVAAGLLRRIALAAVPGSGRDPLPTAPALTRRERQTAELIRVGLSDKEIARQLNVSLATTKSHVHNLLAKLHVQRRSQVADCLRD